MITDSISKKWVLLTLVLLAFFSFLRLYQLNVRPMHNDESVNAMFMDTLVKSNRYKYDPTNYHGPSLYFIHLTPIRINSFLKDGYKDYVSSSASGLTEGGLRFPVAVAGILVLLGCFLLRHRLGLWGFLTAFALMGLSANLIYFSRYFIHEIYVVLFTFGIYTMGVQFNDTKRPSYFYGLAIFSALLFTTKETSVIHLFVLGFSLLCTEWTYALLNQSNVVGSTKNFVSETFSRVKGLGLHLIGAVLVALFIWATLYSSFYIHWDGLIDSFRSYKFWGDQGLTSGHAKNFYYFFHEILFRYEFGVTVLSLVGLIVIFLRKEKQGLFMAFWMLGTIGGYSVVPYKTPWCVINMVLPMAIVSGYGVQHGIEWVQQKVSSKQKKQILGVVTVAIAVVILFQVPQMFRVIFTEYDKAEHVQVYQHTDRDAYNLVDEIEIMADISGDGKDTRIAIVSPEYWPLPYYLREYSNLEYLGRLTRPEQISAPLVVAHGNQRSRLNPGFEDRYTERTFLFRQGVNLILYVRNDLMDKSENRSRVIPDVFEPWSPPPTNLKPGLIKKVYSGMRFRRDPIDEKYGAKFSNFNWRILEDRVYRKSFSANWSGFIKIEQDGKYGFSLESDDGSLLYIDDVLVVDNGGLHAPERKTREIEMKAGWHKFELKYFDWVGEAVLSLKWAPPGQGWRRIPNELYGYKKP